ncbi:MAG: helix-turn-helix domain-containing protein [Halovenus sp.]
MSQTLLPMKGSVPTPSRTDRHVNLSTGESTEVIDALAAESARDIFQAVCAEPMTTADIADVVGTSLQNVQYHLANLEEAGLVEVVDTWYSRKGREMQVYAGTTRRIVIGCGSDSS